MKIEILKIGDIIPYENNAKLHPDEQVEQIISSIEEFGFNDPIAVDENNVVIEGHGRLMAVEKMGMQEIPCIRISGLTDEQKRAYILVHNKLTMNTGFDMEKLSAELDSIRSIDMTEFEFDLDFDMDVGERQEEKDKEYTRKINAPQYEITGAEPTLDDLVDKEKAQGLISEIEHSNVTEEQKKFLKDAATRMFTFNYKNIAEYYAHQDEEMQGLMEKLALVIIDFGDAIKNGFVRLSDEIEMMYLDEDE